MGRVHAFPELTEKCLDNNLYVENAAWDSSNTFKALADAGISTISSEAGITRLGVGAADGAT